MTKIPYITGFNAYLKTRNISTRANDEYLNSLHDFFDYVVEQDDDFKVSNDVSVIHEIDIRQYKDYLIRDLNLSPSTINKILSNLNIYFKYLFTTKINREFPTMNVNSLNVPTQNNFPIDVFENLPKYINDVGLHVYTRLLILIISKGYSYQEAMSKGFFKKFNNLEFSSEEKTFLDEYHDFIEPLRTYWNCSDLFLSRNKGAKSPLLSVSALHRDLKADSLATGLDLTPKKLYTTFVLLVLSQQQPTDEQTAFINNLDASSLIYYRRLLRETNFDNK